MKRYDVVISGFGSVGRQVARLLHERKERYRMVYDADVRLVGVMRSTAGCYADEGLALEQVQAFSAEKSMGDKKKTGADFLAACPFDILIEAGPSDIVTGGMALSYMRTALSRGKHVIAISKGTLVADYQGLHEAARRHGAMLKVSGATAAALPTVDLLQYNLAGCEVALIEGIFTGTANFVLSAMMEEGISMEEAIIRAQQMGIAEPDPRFDLEGWDTACKLTIMANAAFHAGIRLSDVARKGIQGITPELVQKWKADGLVPKLVGSLRKVDDTLQAAVDVQLLSETHPFAQVRGTTKAIRLETDTMGELLVVGGKSDPVAAAAAALKDLEHILQANRAKG
ncbi:homoserine dehydrogenase [Brevibacillus borstelensis]|uniref:homoserine dehydrogenase n=1 Tax=Brevibacillus borstelensis TaxID=45462 RepID=UPI0015623A12|nr:homoserine dehydrogenase [Brevibacillus borstelensis]MBE5394407.1 homoserine dehydrogenase [Brevibacillus borstelensis]